jgi:ketosteroid isomerase-like protein
MRPATVCSDGGEVVQETENTKVVQDAYAAFGRGDIPALLTYLTDDVRWQPVVGTTAQVPFSGEREGKAKVAEFFELVADFERFEQFEPREFVAQGDKVVAIGHYRAVTKPTGRSFESDFVMVFTLRGGKVARFQEFTDSAGINAAFA